MTDKDFVYWLRGFVTACHEYAPTPKQWDELKETLASVDSSKETSYYYQADEDTKTTFTSRLNTKELLKD